MSRTRKERKTDDCRGKKKEDAKQSKAEGEAEQSESGKKEVLGSQLIRIGWAKDRQGRTDGETDRSHQLHQRPDPSAWPVRRIFSAMHGLRQGLTAIPLFWPGLTMSGRSRSAILD
ncbi:unnamed protein product [Clonostachys solani]|uniref:Uncharacterized protein n=1 Tax=Clonostachys solani TaxID=160281 RepID=A0A9N9YSB8_9HYPO|nr:unnamed protein product [Clonostachys solani]